MSRQKNKRYTITKHKKTVTIEMPSDHYEHLCLEARQIMEYFCKDDKVTLKDITDTLPVLSILMPSVEVLKNLDVGDKLHVNI